MAERQWNGEMPRRMQGLPVDAVGGLGSSFPRGLPTPICGSIPGAHARPALPLTAPDYEIVSFVRVILRAVRPVRRLAATDVYALRNRFQMVRVNAVTPTAPALVHVVDGQPFRDWPALPNPGLAMRVAGAAKKAVAIPVMGALPAQASGFRVKERCRVILPTLSLRRRPAAPRDVPAPHRAVDARATSLDLGSANCAAHLDGIAETCGRGACGRAVPLRPAGRRVVRPVRASAALTFPGHVHSRHRTNCTRYGSQSVMCRIDERGRRGA